MCTRADSGLAGTSVTQLLSAVRNLLDLHGQVAGRTVRWPGVQVAASRGDRCMAQGRLHKVDRAASVEGVAGVGVSEPMRAYSRPNPSPPSRCSDYSEDLRGVQMAALAGPEDGTVGVGAVAQARKLLPRCGGQQNYPRPLALSADGNLPSITPLLSIAPRQRA